MDEASRPAGWYADPQQQGELRYWDGASWGPQFRSKGPSLVRSGPLVLGRGFQVLGAFVSVGLQLQVPVYLAQIWLYVWGLSMVDDAVAAGDIDRLDRFDNLDRVLSLTSLSLLVATGIGWMVWQFRLAKSTRPEELQRGPGWHAFAWITPVVGLWFPYQNLRDLWRRRFGGARAALLGWWWAAWIASEILSRLFVARADDVKSVDDFHGVVGLDIAVAVISLIALILAIMIQRALTKAEALGPSSPATPAA